MSELDLNQPQFSTPMMQQYLALKREYPECLLLFRLGDFYEMFLDDALLGANILGITLTSRTRGKDGRIPMAGVPYHAVEGYVAKLLAAGHKVAMCDQLTTPKAGELVVRDVTRVLTPGTVVADSLLTAHQSPVVAFAVQKSNQVAIALANVAEGKIYANEFSLNDTELIEILNTLNTQFEIREWLGSDLEENLQQWLEQHPEILLSVPSSSPTKKTVIDQILNTFFPINTPHRHLLAVPLLAQAVATIMEYLQYTQKTAPRHCQLFPLLADTYLHLDAASLRHLEVLPTSPIDTTPTLFSIINFTQTAAGNRLLRHWLVRPLADISSIEARQKCIEFFLKQPLLHTELQSHLRHILDIERIIARLTLNAGNPRDVVALAQSITAIQTALSCLKKISAPALLQNVELPLELISLAKKISDMIVAEPPIDPRQGGIIQPNFDSKIDQLRHIATNQRTWLAELEQQLRTTTTISSLKVRYNQVFGFFIEVSKSNLAHVPDTFVRKQTLVNAERFTTPELSEAESIILKAETESAEQEFHLFQNVVSEILEHTSPLQTIAREMAIIDCLQSLATAAQTHRYVAPTISSEGSLTLVSSRHPVLEKLPHIASFVPNDVELNHATQQLILLTGPNMAGKSVLMRQVALITLLAHIGSFVPAKSATIPLTDRIFVRSGAGDAMTQGLSTFMVEMVETAAILRESTSRSLVIMDEIGRGTSTHDGISLAWAVAEYLTTQMQPGPLTLFATHYHELQDLAEHFPTKIKNFHLAITEHAGKLVFLYTLQPGGASESHGLKVAELAGVPEWVITKAKAKLTSFSTSNPLPSNRTPIPIASQALDHLKTLNPDTLTPKQALEELYTLLDLSKH